MVVEFENDPVVDVVIVPNIDIPSQ